MTPNESILKREVKPEILTSLKKSILKRHSKEESWMQTSTNAFGWPWVDCEKVANIRKLYHSKKIDGVHKTFHGIHLASKVVNSSYLWPMDSELWLKKVVLSRYEEKERESKLLEMEGKLSANHAVRVGFCPKSRTFVEEFLPGADFSVFINPNCLPDFQGRLQIAINVIETIVDLNINNYFYKDFAFSQWHLIAESPLSKLKLVDIDGAWTLNSSMWPTFPRICNPDKDIGCPLSTLLLPALEKLESRYPDLKLRNSHIFSIDKAKASSITCAQYFETVNRYDKGFFLFWSALSEYFPETMQLQKNPFFAFQAVRAYKFIRILLRKELIPFELVDKVEGIIIKLCDIFTPWTTKIILLKLKLLLREVRISHPQSERPKAGNCSINLRTIVDDLNVALKI